ncbi:MAG: hypothetical protein KY433_09675, partial [Actinobacteria bacterium]|nr:hypothetical protein [Actinomycetota bacterium]
MRPAAVGSRIRVSCKGGGCPFKVRTRTVRATVRSYSLTSLVRRAKLRPRTVLEVRVSRRRMIGKLVRFRMRSGMPPQRTIFCQAPNASRPSACTSTTRERNPATTTVPGETASTATPTTTSSATTATDTTTPLRPVPPAVDRLRFGVYPWGGVGCVEQCAPAVPEDANRSMAAVKQLKGSRSFVVHVYGDYDGVSDASADRLLSEASWWSSNGLKVAAVLRYRPADAGKAAGYQAWTRRQARRLAALAGTVSIQIANEPNNAAPDAGDGSYPGVIGAIAAAVPAARAEVVAADRPDIRIGFNWAAG